MEDKEKITQERFNKMCEVSWDRKTQAEKLVFRDKEIIRFIKFNNPTDDELRAFEDKLSSRMYEVYQRMREYYYEIVNESEYLDNERMRDQEALKRLENLKNNIKANR